MALQEVLNSSIWVIKDDKSNYQPLYGQFLYALNTDASGDDDKGMLYVGNGTEWINVMGTALPSIVENILATVPFEQIDNKTIFDAINEKANKATTLEGYGIEDAYTKTTIDAIILALEAELAGKQDKLTAGNNISIDGNKISVTGLTKASVGLDQVDNTSDADKPISTATQTALDLKADKSQVANISTDGNTTKIQGNLEVSEIDTGETGSVITGTLVAHGQVDVDSISVGASSTLDSVSTSISSTSTDTEIPTAKSVYSSVSLRALNDASNLTTNNVNAWKGKLGISDIETEVTNKADKATTLGGYGITDAKIADGTITLGENSITPLTASSDISGDKVKGIVAEATKATQDGDGNVISETYATTTVVEGKQDKLSAGANITIDENTNTISATDTTYTAGTNISISNANAISVTGVYTSEEVDEKLATKADTSSLNDKQNKLTAGTNITIDETTNTINATDTKYTAGTNIAISDENAISVTGLTKASVGLGNVDNTSDANKPISTATQSALDGKQNKLTAGANITISDTNEISATDTKYTAGANISISNANAIAVTGVYTSEETDELLADKADKTAVDNINTALNSKADKATTLAGYDISDAKIENGTITLGDNTIAPLTSASEIPVDKVTGLTKASVGLGNVDNTSDANKPISTATQTALDAKQDISNLVTTIDSTSDDTHYPSAKAVYDYAQASVTSTVETTVTPTTAQMATVITGALAKKARVVVIPSLANVGAIYIKESDTYSSVNPIYPDPANNMYEFTNMQNVKVFVDSVGDSLDLVIEYRG